MMYPKSVYLDYGSSSNERLVTQEGYDQIKDLIKFYQVCKECRNRTNEAENLLMGKNVCLACILRKHPEIRFLGPVDATSDGDITYAFIDNEEVTYTITTNSSEDIRKDLFGSLMKAGFQPPTYYTPFKGDKNNPVELNRYNWTVYGKLTNSVIVLEYSSTYPNIKAVFLCYREGEAVELNKRNLAFKQMFERAKAVIERTKHKKWGEDHYYRPDGTEISRISDDDLFPIIAQFESAVWDVQRQFMPAYTQPELIQAEEQPLPTVDNEEVNLRLVPQNEAIPVPEQIEEVKQEEEVASENQETETVAPQVEESSSESPSTLEDQAEPDVSDIDVTNKSKRRRGQLSVVSKE